MPRVYLDHAATSPLTEAARATLRACEDLLNASSVHREGQRARAALEEARALVASSLGVHDDEITFTGSGTEADNLALRGACWAAGGRPGLVTTAIEHEAVGRTARWLDAKGHARTTLVAPNADGVVDARAVLAAIAPDTALVSVMLVNNEVGTLQPVDVIGRECRARGVTFHVDAVQALGRMPVRPGDIPADLLTLSGHKVGGPKGCGVLFARRGLKLQPALTGGAQESGLRPGTEAVATFAAAARAIADAVEGDSAHSRRLAGLTALLEAGILGLAGACIHGTGTLRAPGLTSAAFDGVPGDALVQALDLAGFAASTGSACTSGSTAPSHVLAAMGLPEATCRATVRFSLGIPSTMGDVAALLAALPRLLEQARRAPSA